MSVQTQITRLTTDKNTIKAKMVELGLGTSTDTLDELATEVSGIVNKGAVDAEVKEGETYTIPAGYHNGAGTVKGVAGGGSYNLQAKTGVTPTKASQSITPDSGYYGLSSVQINAIPDAYQDVSSVTADAGSVLTGKTFVPASGTLTAGTMANNGAVDKTLDATTTEYTVPTGYHNGSGTVSIVTEEKTATPSDTAQNITPTTGKVLSKVVVNAIPSQYKDTSSADVTAADILTGKIGFNASGSVTGTMTNHGVVTATLTGLGTVTGDTEYTIAAGYYATGSKVSFTSDIETALAGI